MCWGQHISLKSMDSRSVGLAGCARACSLIYPTSSCTIHGITHSTAPANAANPPTPMCNTTACADIPATHMQSFNRGIPACSSPEPQHTLYSRQQPPHTHPCRVGSQAQLRNRSKLAERTNQGTLGDTHRDVVQQQLEGVAGTAHGWLVHRGQDGCKQQGETSHTHRNTSDTVLELHSNKKYSERHRMQQLYYC